MKKFKDFLEDDMSVFMNGDEFATNHNINGKQVSIILDNDRLSWRRQKEYDGLIVGTILFFVKATDLNKPIRVGEALMLDNKPYTVMDVRENDGMIEIILDRDVS